MGKRRRKLFFEHIEKVKIDKPVAEGNCIARVGEEQKVVFVKHAAPGDIVDLQIVNKKKNYLEARITQFHTKSDLRIEPKCSHYGICGGCKWQHLPYSEQLKLKQEQVVDNFERIGGFDNFFLLPILGSNKEYEYRNKLELTFSAQAWEVQFNKEDKKMKPALGFHIPGKFDKVLNIDKCHLMPDFVNEVHRAIFQFSIDNEFDFFHLKEQTGFLRNVIFRCNRAGEWLVLLSFRERDIDKIELLLEFLKNKFSQISSLLFVINEKRNDIITDLEAEVYSGKPYLSEKLLGVEYTIHPQSFFQTNADQAEILYQTAIDFAGFKSTDLVYDLYTGIGSIALSFAHKVNKVIGIEYVEKAVEDAKLNARFNGIDNCEFYAGDMRKLLNDEFVKQHGKPNVVVTDPPRDGMHPDVVKCLLNIEAEKIVYISCNPATQARDAKLLREKYSISKMQAVDMFPQTHHIENIAVFNLNL